MRALYNEIEPYAAQWLRNLSEAGHVTAGDVDERSVAEIRGADLADRGQCHFFAGIGVWSRALRIAGVPDELPVWTGSCPCQPFSNAGARRGVDDPRHLWPEWFRLISECRPGVILGEQVASQDGLGWLDIVLADLEDAGYACAAVDLCAAGVGAPHIRQRLWFVAVRLDLGERERELLRGWLADPVRARPQGRSREAGRPRSVVNGSGPVYGGPARLDPVWLADDDEAGLRELGASGLSRSDWLRDADGRGALGAGAVGLGDTVRDGDREFARELHGDEAAIGSDGADAPVDAGDALPGHANGFWADHEWVVCSDGKVRPVEPGTFPLAHGAPARVGRLRAYGNAIVSEAAAAHITCALEAVCEVLGI